MLKDLFTYIRRVLKIRWLERRLRILERHQRKLIGNKLRLLSYEECSDVYNFIHRLIDNRNL